MLLTFLRRIWSFRYSLEDEEIAFALVYCYNITRRMVRSTKLTLHEGQSPMCGDLYLWPVIVDSVEEFMRYDPDRRLVDSRFRGHVVVPEYREESVRGGSLLLPGDSIIDRVTPKIALYNNLGLVDVEKVVRVVSGAEGYSEVLQILYLKPSLLYKITCVSPIPLVLVF